MDAIRQGKPADDRTARRGPAEFEGEIREIIRRDVAPLRKQFEIAPDASTSHLNSVIQRVAATSVTEVEKLITELQSLRDVLQSESQRVQREITGYVHLSQVTMNSTGAISESLAHVKGALDTSRAITSDE